LVHGPYAANLLEGKITPGALDAIVMHNEMATGKERSTEFQHALAAGETITGLITATALVYPDKKLASVKVKSITKRMKEKAFAASVKRENILECEKIGIPMDEFAGLSLQAMQEISDELGL
jgi:predicted hydrolase (HD superfamily)